MGSIKWETVEALQGALKGNGKLFETPLTLHFTVDSRNRTGFGNRVLLPKGWQK